MSEVPCHTYIARQIYRSRISAPLYPHVGLTVGQLVVTGDDINCLYPTKLRHLHAPGCSGSVQLRIIFTAAADCHLVYAVWRNTTTVMCSRPFDMIEQIWPMLRRECIYYLLPLFPFSAPFFLFSFSAFFFSFGPISIHGLGAIRACPTNNQLSSPLHATYTKKRFCCPVRAPGRTRLSILFSIPLLLNKS